MYQYTRIPAHAPTPSHARSSWSSSSSLSSFLEPSSRKNSRSTIKLIISCILVAALLAPAAFLLSPSSGSYTSLLQQLQPAFSITSPSPSSELDGTCSRTLLYTFAGSHGFASEYLIFLRVAWLAKKYNYALFVDDSRWNYGRWTDYFMPIDNSCTAPSNMQNIQRARLAPHPRDPEVLSANNPPFWVGADHVKWSERKLDYLDRLLVSHTVHADELRRLHEADILNWPLNKPLTAEETLPSVFRQSFDELEKPLKTLWKLNPGMEASMKQADLPGNRTVIAAHIRLGDKARELINYGPHVFEAPDSRLSALRQAWLRHWKAYKAIVGYASGRRKQEGKEDTLQARSEKAAEAAISHEQAEAYLKAASDLARAGQSPIVGLDAPLSKPILVLMTDDTSGAGLKSLLEHPLADAFEVRIGLTSDNKDAEPRDDAGTQSRAASLASGFVEASFNSLSPSKRVAATRPFLRDLSFLANRADGFVFTGSSNVGRLLALLAGHEKMAAGSFRSTDVRWFPTVRYQ